MPSAASRCPYVLLLSAFMAACDYDHVNPFDPEFEGELRIAGPTSIVEFGSVQFRVEPSDQSFPGMPFLWTSTDPSILTLDIEGVGVPRRDGIVTVSARYFGPRAELVDLRLTQSVQIEVP